MKITDVKVHVLESPLEYGTELGDGEVSGVQHSCVFTVTTDAGLVGYSQLETQPHVAQAIVMAPQESAGIFCGLRSLAIGEDPRHVERLWDKLFKGSYYYGRRGAALQAISGIDIACWDILGKATGLPVAVLLGGIRRDKVPAYASTLFRSSIEANRDAGQAYKEKGFKAVKFGWGAFGKSLKNDVAMVEAAREGVGSECELMVDAGWRKRRTYKDAIQMINALNDYGLFWIEEPCFPEDYQTYRRVADAVDVRIAAGESESTAWSFRHLAVEGGIDVLQPDISRCGGLTVARRVAALADELNLMICPHAWGSDILTAATLQFVASLPQETFLEFNTSNDPLSRDLVTNPLKLIDGHVHLPTGPGLGIEPNLDAIGRLQMRIA
jgi:L-alanine-DL-glutamate epimerase-like enolase superfamily enzyme